MHSRAPAHFLGSLEHPCLNCGNEYRRESAACESPKTVDISLDKISRGGSGARSPRRHDALAACLFGGRRWLRMIFGEQIADRSTIRFSFDLGAQQGSEAAGKIIIVADVTQRGSADDRGAPLLRNLQCRLCLP